MKLLTKAVRKQLPPLYAMDEEPDPLVICKFFFPAFHWTWYAIEFDGDDLFFGFVDGDFPELGYFRLSELTSHVDRCYMEKKSNSKIAVVECFTLFGNTVMCTIGTKDTTIARFWSQLGTTTGTLMKNQSGINRNRELLDETTNRTGEIGLGDNFRRHHHSLGCVAFCCCQNA